MLRSRPSYISLARFVISVIRFTPESSFDKSNVGSTGQADKTGPSWETTPLSKPA